MSMPVFQCREEKIVIPDPSQVFYPLLELNKLAGYDSMRCLEWL